MSRVILSQHPRRDDHYFLLHQGPAQRLGDGHLGVQERLLSNSFQTLFYPFLLPEMEEALRVLLILQSLVGSFIPPSDSLAQPLTAKPAWLQPRGLSWFLSLLPIPFMAFRRALASASGLKSSAAHTVPFSCEKEKEAQQVSEDPWGARSRERHAECQGLSRLSPKLSSLGKEAQQTKPTQG